MSGGSQHNPNGRQAQLGAGWSPLQLQVANFLARAPQAHLAPERGVTWHTPTPPPHLYHVPAPSPPDPLQGLLQLQAMKASGNALFRHTATPPELYRHTPTPPDKHLMRHTPSPGDVKAGSALPPAELYPHLGPGRVGDKLPRSEESFPRGVDLSTGARGSNGAHAHTHPPHPPHPASPALSVRDAPTINSLIARAQPRPGHARVDALLERLSSPASPHSVIVHSRQPHTPSPPDSNEDSADSCGAPPGSKRKRKPERTVRVSTVPPPPAPTQPTLENGDAHTQNGPQENETKERTEPAKEATPPRTEPVASAEAAPPTTQAPPPDQSQVEPPPPSPEPHARRKTRSNSAETIDEIAAMIAADPAAVAPPVIEPKQDTPVVTIDKLESVLASPDPKKEEEPAKLEEQPLPLPLPAGAPAAPRRSPRVSDGNAPLHEPSEARPAETAAHPTTTFVEVENQLEKMFAGLEEEPSKSKTDDNPKPKKRRKSAPTKGEAKAGRRTNRALTGDGRRKGGKKKAAGKVKKTKEVKDAYDSGSNASSSRSRGPYIQIRGPRDSPLSVSVINAATGEDDSDVTTRRKPNADEFRNGLRARGLHASTLGLRYDATTPDATWLCVFCQRGPHAAGLGDLFGPYTVDTDCEEYRAVEEATRRRYPSNEVWLHAECGVWAPGLLAAGARVWGLPAAVWGGATVRCAHCGTSGATLHCALRPCTHRAHLPCAKAHRWHLDDNEFRALCPRHAQ